MTQTHQLHQPPLLNRRETYTGVTDATYTAKAGDQVIGVNRAGAVTITLPSAEVRPGRIYTIKDESGAAATNNITIDTEGAETIDGSATDSIVTDYGANTYYSDGSNWFAAPMAAAGHAQAHTAASHSDQGATGSELETLTDGSQTALHSHAGLSQANQAAIEAETNEDSYVPPDLLRNHPGACKAWVHIVAVGTISSPSYNITSITDTAVGDRTIVFDTDFSSTIYIGTGGLVGQANAAILIMQVDDPLAVGSARLRLPAISDFVGGFTLADRVTSHTFHGDQ